MGDSPKRKLGDFFTRGDRGAVALLFALALLPILLVAGFAVDFMRASRGKAQVQGILDAAALAVARAEGQPEAERIAIGERYFADNFDSANAPGAAASRFTIAADRVVATAALELPTVMMQVVGVRRLEVGALTEVMRPITGSAEVALALDFSHSMTDNGKFARMAAVAANFIDSLTKDRPASSELKFGLVPFSDVVALDLPKPYVLGQSGPGTWTGCTQDRQFPYNRSDMTPNANPATRWGEVYHLWDSTISVGSACSEFLNRNLKLAPLSAGYTRLKARVDAMIPFANTNIALGAEFGWHLLSPTLPFAAEPYGRKDNHKFMVLLTDGMQTTKGRGPGQAESVDNALANLDEICSAMKGEGIVVFTIGYDVTDPAILTRLEACASPGKFFQAEVMGDDLRAAFDNIGGSIKASLIYLDRQTMIRQAALTRP